jgi:hypothetical protein
MTLTKSIIELLGTFDDEMRFHRWLCDYSRLLDLRYEALPSWAIIRQGRILKEWGIAIGMAQEITATWNERYGEL